MHNNLSCCHPQLSYNIAIQTDSKIEEYWETGKYTINVTYFQDRPPRCDKPKVCNLWHKSGVRYMRTCQVTFLQSGLSITSQQPITALESINQ